MVLRQFLACCRLLLRMSLRFFVCLFFCVFVFVRWFGLARLVLPTFFVSQNFPFALWGLTRQLGRIWWLFCCLASRSVRFVWPCLSPTGSVLYHLIVWSAWSPPFTVLSTGRLVRPVTVLFWVDTQVSVVFCLVLPDGWPNYHWHRHLRPWSPPKSPPGRLS